MSKTTLLYHPVGGPSAKRLAAYMGIEATKALDDSERPDYLIRWGSRAKIPLLPSKRTFNRRRMICRYTNRLEELQRLRDAGVVVPPFSPHIAGLWSEHGILGRDFGKDKQTTGGKGIKYYPPHAYPSEHDFLVAYIPKDRQFRVHVIGGETRTRELVPENESAKDNPIWNYNSGFTFKYPKGIEIPLKVVPAAVQAVKALWLDFGAVDVITQGDAAYVLEVNTAPGLADPTLEWYGENLGKLTELTDMPRWSALE